MNAPQKIHGVRLPQRVAVRSDSAPMNSAMKMEAIEPTALMVPSTAVELAMPMSRRRCGTSTDIVM